MLFRSQDALWNRATTLLPKKNSATYNSALLDLGAMVCLPREPKCGICPVKKFCRARNPASLPIKRARPATKRLIENHVFIAKHDKLLLAKSQKRWRGMWILPPLNGGSKKNGAIYKAAFPFTNHSITLKIFPISTPTIGNGETRWFSFGQIESIPVPSPHRRAIDALLN